MSDHRAGIRVQPALSRYGLLQAELCHLRWLAPRGDEVLVFGIALQVAGDKLALRHDRSAFGANVFQHTFGETRADAAPRQSIRHLGVDQTDRPVRLVAELN